eukprot:TRINITY_DN12898_c0_g2_i1.p1 TRINITY_DN12898_c0_g2~~TRINITY_DN12898_c0_g2_i1.p1  ORF type:complete len:380 (-),score=57.41 TRINITY_DN12898_c0_g2_i1:93-1232(-)
MTVTSAAQPQSRCYLEISIEGVAAGPRVVVELYEGHAPLACANFRQLCTGERGTGPITGKPLHYLGSTFHRVIPGFVVQAGDFSEGNGRGGESVHGRQFADDPGGLKLKHDRAGVLSMANSGKPNTNGSQFLILLTAAPHLDGKHVVFGRVVRGMNTIRRLERVDTGPADKPVQKCEITACGQLLPEEFGDDKSPEVGEDGDRYLDYPEDQSAMDTLIQAVQAAEEVRQLGNQQFQAGEIEGAVVKYSKALRYLDYAFRLMPADAGEAAVAQVTVREKKVPCLANRAMCELKLRRWRDAKATCDRLLALDPTNAKGLFRRAQASKELREWEDAETDAQEALRAAPTDPAIKKLLQEVRQETQAQKSSAQRQYSRMFASA